MTDDQLLAAFEDTSLEAFPHRTHIHIAWLYLRRDGWDIGYRNIQQGLQRFAAAKGAHTKYHETITRFWALLIQHTINEAPHVDDFDAFLSQFPILMDKTALTQHYSADVLKSPEARAAWHEPDLIPMPVQ